MKIAYISSPYFADCDFPLIKKFQEEGHDVMTIMLLIPQGLRSTLINIKRAKKINGIIRATDYPEFALYKKYLDMDNFYLAHRTVMHAMSFTYFKIVRQQIKMMDNFNPDVVVLTSPPYTMDLLMYKFRKKMVLIVHDPFPHSGEQWFMREMCRKLAFKLCPKLVLLNKLQKKKFMQTYGIDEKRILINRLDQFDCINIYSKENAKKEDQTSSKNILFFGRISPYKGIEYLLSAMKIVHKHIPDATLTIAGGGKMYIDISEYKELSYINIKNYYIEMKELTALLNNCCVTVCPYKDATQSGVIMTSYAMNKPVIASNVGALSEYIEDGKTGLLVPPCNIESLAEALIKVLSNNILLQKMELNIKKHNQDNQHGWNEIADKYIEFFQKKI